MTRHYQVRNLTGIEPSDFQRRLESFLAMSDGAMEGYRDSSKQRDLSVRFHWGHHHDFGSFMLPGRMGWRHVHIPAALHDEYGFPLDLSEKKVLDIGVWTGGTALLLCALGASVVAIEEVKKYADALEFLKESFGLAKLDVRNQSIYDFLGTTDLFDSFDYVLFSGVIYHLSDPVLASRIVFNLLKDGGLCFVESGGIPADRSLVSYEGPNVFLGGSEDALDRSGWNWFVPSQMALKRILQDVGFGEVNVGSIHQGRLLASAKRLAHVDMNRAGLSVRGIR